MKLFKEPLNGKYDGVTPATLLPAGSVSDGLNMRKVSALGGWKVRKGCTLHNSTTLGANSILSLHQYTHPLNDDYHFMAQYNGNLHDATNDPPADGTTFGSSISSDLSTTQPGFSCMVNDQFFYADGSVPLTWGGDNPYCTGFKIFRTGSATEIHSYTKRVTDGKTTTYASLRDTATDDLYICAPERLSKISIEVGSTVNSETVAMTLYAMRSGSWTDAVGTDGTISGGATIAQDGDITFAKNAADEMSLIDNQMGYWYKVEFSAALTDGTQITSCKVEYDMCEVTNKWNGVFEYPAAVRQYNDTSKEYANLTGKVTNESTGTYMQMDGHTTSDWIYIKTIEPIIAVGFAVVDGYENTAVIDIDEIDVWDGDSWTSVGTLDDRTLDDSSKTKTLSQSALVSFDRTTVVPCRGSRPHDSVPGYWYRVGTNGTLDNAVDDIRVSSIVVANKPEDLDAVDGVIEFKNRLFMWGEVEYPNRLRYSCVDRPDCFSGSDSGHINQLGDMSKIVAAAHFYHELIIFKANEVWLLEGYSPATFGPAKVCETIGCCSPKTVQVIETGFPSIKTDEPMSIAIWMDTDGIYVFDGRKPKKVSGPVNHFFDTEYSTAIEATKLDNCQSFVDRLKNEYHLIVPYSATQAGFELVYNYVSDEFYPKWTRQIDLVTGLIFRGTDNRYYVYGGSRGGLVMKLEDDTSDKTTSDVDQGINHSIKTRAISAEQGMTTTMRFTFRGVHIEAVARTSPTTKTIACNFFKDLATSGTALTKPDMMDLTNAGYDLVLPKLSASHENCGTFQLEFSVTEDDLELEVHSFLYAVDARGEIDF